MKKNRQAQTKWFVSFSVFLFVAFVVAVAIKQEWHLPSMTLYVEFERADGLYPGTVVQVLGLKAGEVEEVSLTPNRRIRAELKIRNRFVPMIREDAKITAVRPYIIGERVLTLDPGSDAYPAIKNGMDLKGSVAPEITELLNSEGFGIGVENLRHLLNDVKDILAHSQNENGGVKGLYEQTFKTLQALEGMGKDISLTRRELLTKDTKKLVMDLASLSEELKSTIKQGHSMMPNLGQASKQSTDLIPKVEKTLTETLFTLQALQRSFVLRGGVERLIEEQKKESVRSPAKE